MLKSKDPVKPKVVALIVALLAGPAYLVAAGQDRQLPRPTFRSGVDRVAVATSVRDRKGKPVIDLKAEDFRLVDSGQPRRINEVRTESTPINVALLVDYSGSMNYALKREAARTMAGHILDGLTPGFDKIGLFAFDKQLTELAPLGPVPGNILDQLQAARPFGVTSLFDAIAQTGRVISQTPGARRAIVAITDGVDNASALSPYQVSTLASSIDVPVYIVVIISPLDRADKTTIDDPRLLDAAMQGRLADLAHWTGGEIFAALSPTTDAQAARQIVTELRHQYLIVFEPDPRPGWHPIDIQTRHKDLVVRARSGYVVQGRPEQP
jgi:Ca-activated chloride channel homolog